jgi:hypothetical protein
MGGELREQRLGLVLSEDRLSFWWIVLRCFWLRGTSSETIGGRPRRAAVHHATA